jgi:dihydroxyacid dehydratase/phosphogluconate dehydratase
MKMHSSKFRDPLISRAQPVTLIAPLVEETLRNAGIPPNRDLILDHFMNGQPRIVVVHGGEDHPPNLGMKETIRRVIRHIWANGALPFELSQSIPCEELAHGTDGGNYALLSRNLCTAGLAAHMEAHSYDAAVIFGACDKMMVGALRALAEADLAHQRRKARPVFAVVFPSVVSKEAFASEEDRHRFDAIRSRMSDAEREELDQLLQRPMKPNVYAGLKCMLNRGVQKRILAEDEKDELERVMARCTAVPGANCAASEASVVHRMMLASFGVVPRHMDISSKPPTDEQTAEAVRRLLLAIQKRERRVSVAGLIRSNLSNAVSVWSATGGHAAWILHLMYLADAVGKKFTVADVARRARTVPQILGINEVAGNSVYTMALETESGGNSGIDTIMRTLAEKRLIEDRTPTLCGSWMQRIMDARSANGNFLHSTMTPISTTCGISGVQGNLCNGGVVRLGSRGRKGLTQFDKKLYLAVFYLGTKDLDMDLANPDGILERLYRRVTREDLYYTWLGNWHVAASSNGSLHIERWNKPQLWEYLLEQKLIRVMVVVAGIGPHAAGMPELDFSNASAATQDAVGVLVTDGRVSYQHNGISIAHVVPEALDGGALGSIRTGDWIYLDLAKCELQVVRELSRHKGYRPLSHKDLLNRPDHQRRIHELQRQRMDFMPSFRLLLDQISSAETGVSPRSKLN